MKKPPGAELLHAAAGSREEGGGVFLTVYRLTGELLLDLIADDTADGCTTHSADCATASEYRATDRSDTGADRRVFLAGRHIGTSTEAEQHGDGEGAYGNLFNRFHGVISFGLLCLATRSADDGRIDLRPPLEPLVQRWCA